MTDQTPTRIQVAVRNVLVAEWVVANYTEANEQWAAWTCLRYRRQKPLGGATISRADLPRYWNVPVGTEIRKD